MIIFGIVLMLFASIWWIISLFRANFLDVWSGIALAYGWMILGIIFVIGLISTSIGLLTKFIK